MLFGTKFVSLLLAVTSVVAQDEYLEINYDWEGSEKSTLSKA
jgi:hypothetical protein